MCFGQRTSTVSADFRRADEAEYSSTRRGGGTHRCTYRGGQRERVLVCVKSVRRALACYATCPLYSTWSLQCDGKVPFSVCTIVAGRGCYKHRHGTSVSVQTERAQTTRSLMSENSHAGTDGLHARAFSFALRVSERGCQSRSEFSSVPVCLGAPFVARSALPMVQRNPGGHGA